MDWGVSRGGVIERASMDGTARMVLHNSTVTSPVSLALDSSTQTLYWIDHSLSILGRMESSSVNGSNRRLLFFSLSTLLRTGGMAVFQNTIYWAARNERSIHVTSRLNPVDDVTTLWTASSTDTPYEISVVAPSEQPPCKYSQTWLTILAFRTSYQDYCMDTHFCIS